MPTAALIRRTIKADLDASLAVTGVEIGTNAIRRDKG